MESPNITKKYFDSVKKFGDKLVVFINKVEKNTQLMNTIYQSAALKQESYGTPEKLVKTYCILDLGKCLSISNDFSDFKSKETFALLYVFARIFDFDIESYANIDMLYNSAYSDLYISLKSDIEITGPEFILSPLLITYDKDLQMEYLTNLYRFTSIVVKADGTVTKVEEAALKKIMNLSQEEQTDKVITELKEQTLEEVMEELDSLTGLNEVKEEIKSLINFIKIQKAREGLGLKSTSISYHIVFSGNPGTGKTTVARIVSQIYKNLGILKQGQLVETDRSGMIAEYLGQTAIKVNKEVDSALNGVLFIDEAYSLVGENQDDYGKEAVATLIKRMEDDRDKLIVILAGYTNEMKSFIDTNPGIKSRFNHYIDFTDYTPDELISIYEGKCKKSDYKLNDDAKKKLLELFIGAYSHRDKSFGNGRYARNIFEKTTQNQANRIASIANITKEILTTITADDIPLCEVNKS